MVKSFQFLIIFLFLIIALFLSWMVLNRTEHPDFDLVKTESGVEIRHYKPAIVAEVDVTGERKQAIVNGFMTLAAYINGENHSSSKIKMTAPVVQQRGEVIALTTPVTGEQLKDEKHWRVRFYMPKQYTLETLPKPNDNQIKVYQLPEEKFIVTRFSGVPSSSNLNQHQEILTRYVDSKKIETIGHPLLAFYDPPWTLPFLRRNEILDQVKN